ncbi:hypothetical protein scyTo_0013290 [Scyliorhinus torazame]|uniref:Kringle domain-containing protein n=1 Tax=Scyliorhinus torazame TaxID=75743 RepID=A0A401NTD4_SCYTO|nr:hypothetical protein [Scyliorhinus torazame]
MLLRNVLPWQLSARGKEMCYNDNGRFYQGSVNVTASGIPCQKWSQQAPHFHRRMPELFPELTNSENYCRNPGGESQRPWCYTTDRDIRWEFCNVPLCTNAVWRNISSLHSRRPLITDTLDTNGYIIKALTVSHFFPFFLEGIDLC